MVFGQPWHLLLAASLFSKVPALRYSKNDCCEGCVPLRAPAETWRATHKTANFSAWHCDSQGAGQGQFVFKGSLTNPVFRVRLVGPTVELLEVRPENQLQGGTWRANYTLCEPGTYHVEAVLMFEHFDDSADDMLEKKSAPCLHEFATNFAPEYVRVFDLKVEGVSRATPDCRSKAAEGVWVETDTVEHATRGELGYSSEVVRQLTASRVNLSYEMEWPMTNSTAFSSLRYVREMPDCDMDNYKLEPTTRVCLMGDSQMRELSYSLIGLYGASHVSWCDISGVIYPSFTLFPQRFMDCKRDFFPDVANGTSCSHLIVNFGQWQLGHTLMDTPSQYSAKQYAAHVFHWLSDLLKYKEAHSDITGDIPIYWSSMMPFGFHEYVTRCPPTDYRLPPIIEHYNDIAEALVRSPQMRGRVTWIDNYHVASPLNDLSFDGAHFGGVVGQAVAKSLIAAVRGCNSPYKRTKQAEFASEFVEGLHFNSDSDQPSTKKAAPPREALKSLGNMWRNFARR